MLEKTATVRVYLIYLCTLAFCTAPGVRAQDEPVITPEVVWTFETGGTIFGSSTTKEGVVYFGSTDGNVYALDASSGEPVWRFETGGPIYGSVTVYDGYLYTGSDDGYLYKLDLAGGAEIWKANIHEATPTPRGRPADTPPGNIQWDYRGSAPLEVDGMVYVGSPDHHLYALDAETGARAWAFETGGIVRSSPAVSGDVVVFGSFDQRVYAVDKETGEEIWRYSTGGVVSTPAVVYEGVVYIGSRSTRLYALSLETGRVIWTKQYGNGSWVESGGVVYDDTLYIGSSFWSTQLSVNLATGASYWQRNTGGAAYSTPRLTETAHYSGAVGLENNLSGNMKGALVRLDRATGQIVWKFPFEVVAGQYEHGVSATPEVVGETILFGALNGVFYALKETESQGGPVQINQIESFDEAGELESWQNTSAGSYTLTTVADDRVEGAAATRLDYDLVADLDWGGSIDVARKAAGGTFDFSGVTSLAMYFKNVVPPSDPANVSFVFKLVDASTGVQEFWEQTVTGVLDDASGAWRQMHIPVEGFFLPSWTAQGDGVLDLDQVTEWQFQVIAGGTAIGTTTTGAICFDRLETFRTSVGTEEGTGLPKSHRLRQNYPNPFNPSTLIRYELASTTRVALRVYDVTGQQVAVLFDGTAPAGVHDVPFDASALPSGVYYYQIKTGSGVETKPMILVR